VPHTLYLENNVYGIILCHPNHLVEEHTEKVHVVDIPTYWTNKLFGELYETGYGELGWITGECFIRMVYPNTFCGYDEEGKPIFKAVDEDITLGNYAEKFHIYG
jgi:hypothetical protein